MSFIKKCIYHGFLKKKDAGKRTNKKNNTSYYVCLICQRKKYKDWYENKHKNKLIKNKIIFDSLESDMIIDKFIYGKI